MTKEDIYHLIPKEAPKSFGIRDGKDMMLHTAIRLMQAGRPELYSFDLTDSESSSSMVNYLNGKHLESVGRMKLEARREIFGDVFDYVRQATWQGKPLKEIVHDIQGSRLGKKADILLDSTGRNHTRNYKTRGKNLMILAHEHGYEVNILGYEHELMEKTPSAKVNQAGSNGHIHKKGNKIENHKHPKGQDYKKPVNNGFRTIRK